MQIALKLGLDVESICRIATTTKMLFMAILGHTAELHYKKYLINNKINFERAPTDTHYDFVVNGERYQVKRFEADTTDESFLGANLTKTHGDRSGPDAFYKRTDFDKLVLFDVGFKKPIIIDVKDIPKNSQYADRLPGKFKIPRKNMLVNSIDDNLNIVADEIDSDSLEFLKIMKFKNVEFPDAIENFRKKHKWDYKALLEKFCNLTIEEIDSLFSDENFRLIIAIKGFAAEEHFNNFLKKNKIPYEQNKEMYSKIDHWVNKKRVQVKIPNERATNSDYWGVKVHKSHGHGKGELCPADAFDILALFIGFKMDVKKSRYFPQKVTDEFVFVPISDILHHPEYPAFLIRIAKIDKNKYKINDLSVFK